MNKKVISIIFIVVVVGAGFLVYRNLSFQNESLESSGAPANRAPQPEAAVEPPAGTEPKTISPQGAVPQPVLQKPLAGEVKITYTDSGFSPSFVTVKQGSVVTFKNKSGSPFWPASNPHPVHTGYPATGGCLGSTFDACREISPGGSWSFKFDIVGSWRYHDHLRPTNQGTIAVD